MKLTPKLFILTLFKLSSAFAQVNTELMRDENHNKKFSNNFSLDFVYQASQEKYFDIGIGGTSNYFVKDDFHAFLIIDYQSGYLSSNIGNEVIINRGFGHLRVTKKIMPKTDFELFCQAGFNDFILINDRKLFGSGFRKNLIKKNKINSFFGFGLMQEREIYDLLENSRELLLRYTSYTTLTFQISDNIYMNNILYFQPVLKKANDFRLLLDNEIEFKINRVFSTQLKINYRYDNEPHGDSKKTYFQIHNGFEFNF
tara:strand:+ start:353 stop:1120 length:768 start_codon:yes stop_codon:yes gene_type:complete